jgi:hypothetical protein
MNHQDLVALQWKGASFHPGQANYIESYMALERSISGKKYR